MTHNDLMYRPNLLAGQRILVTGGGTSLGRVMAEACLLLGAEVYICGRRTAPAGRDGSRTAAFVPLDIAETASTAARTRTRPIETERLKPA